MILKPLNWAALLFAFSLAGSAFAQNFPVKPVRIVVPFPAGGSADFFSRLIGQKLSESWNQQVIVDNRPGAATVIGTQFVARAPADGYTILSWRTASPSTRACGPTCLTTAARISRR